LFATTYFAEKWWTKVAKKNPNDGSKLKMLELQDWKKPGAVVLKPAG
jgi:hypothetical protein